MFNQITHQEIFAFVSSLDYIMVKLEQSPQIFCRMIGMHFNLLIFFKDVLENEKPVEQESWTRF